MKYAVIEFYHGQEEIISMDDELPLLIFILGYSEVKNLASNFKLLYDYINFYP